MASISTDKKGLRRILFSDVGGQRRQIRLGKMPIKRVRTIKAHIENLIDASIGRCSPDPETSAWAADLDGKLRAKLVEFGLLKHREEAAIVTLSGFVTDYTSRRVDVKPATKEVWRQGETGLIEFFGAEKPLRDISAGDADNYKLHLIGTKLASMTVRKRLQFATMIFRAAMRRRLIPDSPFADVSIKASMPDRSRFITPEETGKILEVCPNIDWRVIVCLSRFGGLRCPSEVLSLRWQDIDWAAGKVTVTSPKTEHHPGKDTRVIPLFPELRTILEEAFEAAPDGAVYVVDEKYRKAAMGNAGWRNCNLRTTFEKIVKRAGLTPWPRLFHNLRSSRQTELAEQFPSHVVCGWLGNSEDIARKHYYQTTDAHFAQATSPTDGGAKSGAKVAQKAAQPIAADPRRLFQETQKAPENQGFWSVPANLGEDRRESLADGKGFEPLVDFRPLQFSRLSP